MEKMMKECMKPHPLLHSLAGIGLGMIILSLVPTLTANAMMIGIVLVILGIGGEFMMKK